MFWKKILGLHVILFLIGVKYRD